MKEKQFPRTKMQWLWDNMEGMRLIYGIAILGTIGYNVLQLTVPYFSQQIVDLFLTGEDAAYNMANHKDLFYRCENCFCLFF